MPWGSPKTVKMEDMISYLNSMTNTKVPIVEGVDLEISFTTKVVISDSALPDITDEQKKYLKNYIKSFTDCNVGLDLDKKNLPLLIGMFKEKRDNAQKLAGKTLKLMVEDHRAIKELYRDIHDEHITDYDVLIEFILRDDPNDLSLIYEDNLILDNLKYVEPYVDYLEKLPKDELFLQGSSTINLDKESLRYGGPNDWALIDFMKFCALRHYFLKLCHQGYAPSGQEPV